MATETQSGLAGAKADKRHSSLFKLPSDFFESGVLLPSPNSSAPSSSAEPSQNDAVSEDEAEDGTFQNAVVAPRLTCNTCKSEFDSLQDQRSHFKSDIHRFNVKLSIAGKSIVKEDDFEELTSDSFKDFDVSSISGSEDEAEKEVRSRKGPKENLKQQLFVHLRTGERVSAWKCLVMNEAEDVLFKNDRDNFFGDSGVKEKDVIERLKGLVCEPRDGSNLRIVLLASGGHFAGCVFDGNSVVAHKTFHRYVVRARAGKKQSTKDAGGRSIHSAGASLRRYNELALKKEIQELFTAWKPYFDASSCVFIYAPSSSRQLLFNGGKPYFSNLHCAVRNIPLIARRPTCKEAKRIYELLTQISHTPDETEIPSSTENEISVSNEITENASSICKEVVTEKIDSQEDFEDNPTSKDPNEALEPSESESQEIWSTTPLHEAAKSNDCDKVMELLETGLDPCAKDERGRTAYMVASEKEVRNTFRRFMALNLDKWDWHEAKVPSALTKEMEESQVAKQADKEAKKKAKAKELKKLRKAKEKKAKAEAAEAEKTSKAAQDWGASSSSVNKPPQSSSIARLSKEEELRRAQAAEREKRAAAAERRMKAATENIPQTGNGSDGGEICSCCEVLLAGKVPFHRYNYKYCSTSCMFVHKEVLEE